MGLPTLPIWQQRDLYGKCHPKRQIPRDVECILGLQWFDDPSKLLSLGLNDGFKKLLTSLVSSEAG